MRNETADVLPKGWTGCTIDEVTLAVSKIDPRDDPDRAIDYIDISSIDNVRQVVSNIKQYRLGEVPSRARQIIHAGDVLFSTVRPYLRNIARVPSSNDQQIASTGFSVLRPAKGICPGFLFYKAISRELVNAVSGLQYGVSYPAVKDEQVRGQPLWLPPTKEQHRIVAKIEELFSELDKGIESLETARRQLEVYRQSVLKHAFEGKLTEQWREENKDKLETSEQLLARVKRARLACHERQLAEWDATVRLWNAEGKPGKKPTKPRRPEALAQLSPGELAKLPVLPDGQAYTYLANLGDLERGKSKHRPRNAPELFGGPYPFIQTGEVKAASRTIRNYSQTYSEVGLRQSRLWLEGTLCITIAANIAETAFLGFDGCFPDSVVGFTATENLVLPHYINLFIESFRTQIEAYAPATAQKNINLTTLQKLVVPLCSLEEQRVLVDRVEATLSVVEEQERAVDKQLAEVEVLRQSILKKAFAGELVAQDDGDEPAAVLLEKIRAERAQAGRNKAATAKASRVKTVA